MECARCQKPAHPHLNQKPDDRWREKVDTTASPTVFALTWLKDFITFIKERGLGEKTLVIITSDHGEELFEHNNLVGHGHHTYDVETHIPYIMWMPGKIPSSVRIKNQVSNVDILPTLVDFLQLEFREQIQGQSLYPLFFSSKHYDERYVFCEAVQQTCVRSLQYKFINSNLFKEKQAQVSMIILRKHQTTICLFSERLSSVPYLMYQNFFQGKINQNR